MKPTFKSTVLGLALATATLPVTSYSMTPEESKKHNAQKGKMLKQEDAWVSIYGSLRPSVLVESSETADGTTDSIDAYDGSTRYGIKAGTKFGEGYKVSGGIEWRWRLRTDNAGSPAAGLSSEGDHGNVNNQVRLSYVKLDTPWKGSFVLGKFHTPAFLAVGRHYFVSRGGFGPGRNSWFINTVRTDGAPGRNFRENGFQYLQKFDKFSLGYMALYSRDNDTPDDGELFDIHQISATYDEKGKFGLGLAYTIDNLPEGDATFLPGGEEDDSLINAAVHVYPTKGAKVALIYNKLDTDAAVAQDGFDLSAKYRVNGRWEPYGIASNISRDDWDDDQTNIVLGANWYPGPKGVSLWGEVGNTSNQGGNSDNSETQFNFGFRYDWEAVLGSSGTSFVNY